MKAGTKVRHAVGDYWRAVLVEEARRVQFPAGKRGFGSRHEPTEFSTSDSSLPRPGSRELGQRERLPGYPGRRRTAASVPSGRVRESAPHAAVRTAISALRERPLSAPRQRLLGGPVRVPVSRRLPRLLLQVPRGVAAAVRLLPGAAADPPPGNPSPRRPSPGTNTPFSWALSPFLRDMGCCCLTLFST